MDIVAHKSCGSYGPLRAVADRSGQMRAFAAATLGVAALVLWGQLTCAPFVYLQVQSLCYPSSLVLSVSLVVVAALRSAMGRFPKAAIVSAGALAAMASGMQAVAGLGRGLALASLLVECLGLSVLACGWMDASRGRGGRMAEASLVLGAFVSVFAYWMLQLCGVVESSPLQPGGAALSPEVVLLAVPAFQRMVGLVLVVALPLVSTWALAHHGSWNAPGQERDTGSAEHGKVPEFLSRSAGRPGFPWAYFAALVVGDVACSVFIGMNTNPFIINSRTLCSQVLMATVAVCALLFVLSWVRVRLSPLGVLALASACLCVGLAMYGSGIADTLVQSLFFVCTANAVFHLLLVLAFVRFGSSLPENALAPMFLVAAAVCLSAVGEQVGLWTSSRWGLGIAQIAGFGMGVLLVVAVITVAVVALAARRGKRQADLAAEGAMAAEVAAKAEREQARKDADEARTYAAEKSLAAQMANEAAVEATRRADEASRIAEEATKAAREAARIADDARLAEERARLAEEKARKAEEEARAIVEEAAGGDHVVEVSFEMSAEEDARLEEYYREHGLSTREIDVMKLVAKRYPNSAIAEKLFISERTVKFHVTNAYRKLDVHSRSELVLAVERSLSGRE